jgi:hypothetical protein
MWADVAEKGRELTRRIVSIQDVDNVVGDYQHALESVVIPLKIRSSKVHSLKSAELGD